MNISICVKNKKKKMLAKSYHMRKRNIVEVKIKSRREKKRIKKAKKAQKLKLLKANAVQRREIKRDLKRSTEIGKAKEINPFILY